MLPSLGQGSARLVQVSVQGLKRLLRWLASAALVLGLLVLLPRLVIEAQWFAQFDALTVVLRRWLFQCLAFALVLGLGLPLQLQQLRRCWRLRQEAPRKQLRERPLAPLASGPLVAVLTGLLLLLVMGLSYLFLQARGLILDPFGGEVITGLSVLADLPPALVLGLAVVLLPCLLRWPYSTLRISLAAALAGSATACARGWSLWLPGLLAVPFGEADPLTGFDLSFTVLRLPALHLLVSLVIAQVLIGFVGCLWLTFSEGTSLTDLRFPGLSREQQRVLQPQLAVLALMAALSYGLSPFDLMVEGSGVASGAGFVDLHIRLPLRLLLALLLLMSGLGLLVPVPRSWFRRAAMLPLLVSACLLPIVEWGLAPLVQRVWVQPRELQLETPYLRRAIAATRRAFGLEAVRELDLEPKQQLSAADLKSAEGTLANVRLWDSGPLLEANRQLQQLRLYYDFPSAAVDRYPLNADASALGSQQVLIAARELDSSALAKGSRTWLNRHLVFTHGYGFTVSPVNVSGSDGLPLYFVKDLGRSGRVQALPQLGQSQKRVEQFLPVGRPRLYFASAPAPYAIAPSQVREFDYPEGELNVYSHYDGQAGVPIHGPLDRLMAAIYLNEVRLLFTGSLTPSSRLLVRRQVNERLQALAPFLRFESKPYLVTARVEDDPDYRPEHHQYWMLDGFTESRSYPYSDANPDGIRYFRNPVKAVVNAYNGDVWLYVNDPNDPVLRTWQKVFPDLFRPLSAMPKALLAHIQVPKSQFNIQAERLLRYHVTDVRTFYNGDDVWALPLEIYGDASAPVRPYHVTMQLPGEQRPEFVLLLPFTPLKRPNMVGWLAARNDTPNYGELFLVRFPQQRLLLGPQQISALIEQDPAISYQFGLWNRVGSRLLRGNLLAMPVGQGLLYVEPIYLQSNNNALPTLVRVVVTDGRRFVMEPTFDEALARLVSVQPNGGMRALTLPQPVLP